MSELDAQAIIQDRDRKVNEVRDALNDLRSLLGEASIEVYGLRGVLDDLGVEDADTTAFAKGEKQTHEAWIKALLPIAHKLAWVVCDDGPFV